MSKAQKGIRNGFTLIELLVVIGILGILLAIVLIAINPAAQFAQANNTARRNDVNTILNAIHQYGADNRGDLSALNIPAVATEISSTGASSLCALLVSEYVSLFPVDPDTNDGVSIPEPDCAGAYSTGYNVSMAADGRVTVSAPGAELVRGQPTVIEVVR